MGIELVEVAPERVVATMPVEGNTQPYGLLHGGASVVLAETLGSIGVGHRTRGPGAIAVGLDINATHHRAATSGIVTGSRHAAQRRADPRQPTTSSSPTMRARGSAPRGSPARCARGLPRAEAPQPTAAEAPQPAIWRLEAPGREDPVVPTAAQHRRGDAAGAALPASWRGRRRW